MQEFALKFNPELNYHNMNVRNSFLHGCNKKSAVDSTALR
jgi:hypothetical protein